MAEKEHTEESEKLSTYTNIIHRFDHPIAYKPFSLAPKGPDNDNYPPMYIRIPRYDEPGSDQLTKEDMLNFLGLILESSELRINLDDCFDGDKPKSLPIWSILKWAMGMTWAKNDRILQYVTEDGLINQNKLE